MKCLINENGFCGLAKDTWRPLGPIATLQREEQVFRKEDAKKV